MEPCLEELVSLNGYCQCELGGDAWEAEGLKPNHPVVFLFSLTLSQTARAEL